MLTNYLSLYIWSIIKKFINKNKSAYNIGRKKETK